MHFGTRIHLHPSTTEVSSFSSQVPVESLGNILDRLNMSKQPSTSRTVSTDIATTKLPATVPTMIVGIPSFSASYQQQAGVQSGTVSATWSVPISSSGFSSGISYVETQQVDPMCIQRPIYPLSNGLLPYGGQYAFSLFPPGEQPYGSLQQSSGQTGITSSGWVPILPQKPRVVYSMQLIHPVSNIPTTPAIVTVLQVQVLPIICQPQVSQVAIKQPLVSTIQ